RARRARRREPDLLPADARTVRRCARAERGALLRRVPGPSLPPGAHSVAGRPGHRGRSGGGLTLGLAVLSTFAAVTGLCVGSFLNVCIHRIPMDRSLIRPVSSCPSCGHPIRLKDNIPVLSWLLLRGRCRDCGASISSLYPTIELLTGIVSLLIFRRVIPTEMALDYPHLGLWALYFSLAAALIANAFI